MRELRIPFNKPFITGREIEYISKVLDTRKLAGNGEFTRRCSSLLQARLRAKKVLLTTSCTAALEMAATLASVKQGDEVIMPSYTFVSTANVFYQRGAKLVFVDIKESDLNMDVGAIGEAISPRTRVIVPVHYGGVGCEMDRILEIARSRNAFVVEDAAQAVNAKYKGAFLGTIGDVGAVSFHETKNYVCGEGGALIINRADLVERAEIVWEKGTNRTRFERGEVDKYTWVDVGSSYLPSEILAAFLLAQLEAIDTIDGIRRNILRRYRNAFQDLEDKGLLRTPPVVDPDETNAHMFYLILGSQKERDDLISHLRGRGIQASFHFVPLHLSPMGVSMGYRTGSLPVTEELSSRLVRLPFFCELSETEQRYVIDEVKSFYSR